MSTVLWDTFTGSAPYREILLRTLHPGFLTRLVWETMAGMVRGNGTHNAPSGATSGAQVVAPDHQPQ